MLAGVNVDSGQHDYYSDTSPVDSGSYAGAEHYSVSRCETSLHRYSARVHDGHGGGIAAAPRRVREQHDDVDDDPSPSSHETCYDR